MTIGSPSLRDEERRKVWARGKVGLAPRRRPQRRARSRAPRPRVALGATTVTESGPAAAGTPVAGSMRWWSRPPGPKRRVSRPDVATPPPASSSVPARRPAVRESAMSTRHGPPSGGDAPDGDVSAQIDERAGQRRPGRAHGPERARGGEALADAAEVDGCALLEARPSCLSGRPRPATRVPARRAALLRARSAARTSGRSRPRRAPEESSDRTVRRSRLARAAQPRAPRRAARRP